MEVPTKMGIFSNELKNTVQFYVNFVNIEL